MRVKIRGLVFVGFAAAVFAQSAMADATTDAKTVTSKLYVDSKIEGVTETGSGNNITYGDTTIDEDAPNDKAPSALNVYKFVTTTVGNVAGNIQGDNEYTKVTSTTSGNVTTKTVELQQAPATANSNITGTLDTTTEKKLVTAGAVKSLLDTSLSDAASGNDAENDTTVPTSAAVVSYAEKKGNKLDGSTNNTITDFYTSPTMYPSAKAVYDFVKDEGGRFQPKVERTGPSVGIRTGSGTSDSPYTYTWGGIQAQGGNTLGGTTENYVTMTESSGVYSIGLATTMVGVDMADITNNTKKLMTGMGVNSYMTDLVWTTTDGTIASAYQNDARVPTVKNVYDFVTGQISTAGGDYQPKVGGADSYGTNSSKVMIGYTTRGGSEGAYTYTSEWKPLSGSTYVTVSTDSNGGTVALTNLAADADLYAANATNDAKLVTAGSVRTMRDTTLTSTNESDQTIPTSKAVVDYVNGQVGDIVGADMPTECRTSGNSGVYCALVASYDATLNNNAGGVKYEWTIMAPVPSGS